MSFFLPHFLPYLLNQASEAASAEFQAHYKDTYGMLRTEWRVLFHLGVYGQMTAKQICEKSSLHKTKVSRAVRALEKKRYLKRDEDQNDRRLEHLALSPTGEKVFKDLQKAAKTYDDKLTESFSPEETAQLRNMLAKISGVIADPMDKS